MRAPDFWRTQNGIARLLEPAGLLYAAAGRLRRGRTNPYRSSIPVVCVGNIVAGGRWQDAGLPGACPMQCPTRTS